MNRKWFIGLARDRMRRLSLRTKISLIFFVLIALPLGLQGSITYYDYSDSVERRAADYAVQIVDQINLNVDRTLMEMQRLSLMPLYDQKVLDILLQYSRPQSRTLRPTTEEMEKMSLYISGSAYNRPEVRGIQIIANNGYVFSNVDPNVIRFYVDYTRESWFERVREGDGGWVAIPAHRPSYYMDGDGQDYFSVARLLREPLTNERIGLIKIDLKRSVFERILANLKFENEGSLFVVNADNELFFEMTADAGVPDKMWLEASSDLPDGNDVRRVEIGGQRYLRVIDASAYSGLKVVRFIPLDVLLEETKNLRDFTVWIAVICLALAYVMALYFSHKLSRPLVRLKKTMLRVEQGHFSESVPVESQDEIGQLGRGFNRMMEEINRLVNEVYLLGLREKEAELAALQSRIHPHFIYNTLESINMLAIERQNHDVSDMVTALGKLLRYTVDRYDRLVRLEEELTSVQSYVKIQQLRYGDRLRVIFDVEEGLSNVWVPKLLFQPLVENAIQHGIGDRESGGTVWISGVRFEDQLILTVSDDGRGLNEQEIGNLRRSLEVPQPEGDGRGGLALRNIAQRIRLMYGEPYGLDIDGSPGRGAVFTITLPIERRGREHVPSVVG
ncbi:sensor histidine kinase [Paenibacillus thermoaerophilus]|uniref:histidine kinase n=1 Tax=Paenibacillus thermoaerophilus TaxID=1215385 RepID=A0ABW2V6A9_9BACL|nr:sensor histidine kinase [Paenibacillus thermoaerophilus]